MKSSKSPGNLLLIVFTIIVVSLACNLPGDEAGNLSLSPRAEDGSVSGSYTNPKGMGDQKMLFSVTADGFATYHIEGAPESEWLAVGLNDDQTAIISWQGIVLDGSGPLTDEEQTALDELMDGELAAGLEMIPLDIGCQGEDQIDPKQVAALMVPLQLRFKYQVTARSAEALELMALSECGYGNWEQGKAEKTSVIQLSPSSPVPAVFGYFPLDEAGGVDPPASSLNGGHTACLPASTTLTDGGIRTIELVDANIGIAEEIGTLPYGPCDARCRGACGSDCTLNNCTEKDELRCEVDDQGKHTGMEVKYQIYECGVHEACIEHDACYDDCNLEYGCETWDATYCMRGVCDAKTIAYYGWSDGFIWSRGLGVQPIRETYEYPDESFEKQPNLEKCPLEADPSSVGEGDGKTDQERDESEEKNNIPVGTYIYDMLVNDEPPPGGDDWEYELESEFIIRVANDGTVTGFKIYRIWVDSVSATGCVTRSEEGFTTNVLGFLEGNQGYAKLENKHWDFWEYHGEECGDGKDYFKDEEDICEAIITVSGNQMEISCQGQVIYTLTKE
jgi:hypothetical protein